MEISMINEEHYYLRNPDIVAVGTTEHYLFIDVDGSVLALHTQSPAHWSRLMQMLMVPTRGDALRSSLAGSIALDPIDLTLLHETGFLLDAPTPTELDTRRNQVFTNNQG